MNIIVGVTGSIAAYKSLDFVNDLVKKGHNVRVIMTKHATAFIQPLSFESLSKNKVYTDMFSEYISALEHINIAKWADVLFIVPATANFIAKAANGIADDFLSTVLLAFDGPTLIAPAMNTVMYHQQTTQDNIKKLHGLGYTIVETASGRLACGDVGEGKLAEREVLTFYFEKAIHAQSLKNKKIIVTAGPTISELDPVRYITNRSSGKMGVAIARQAALRGASVTLICGKTPIQTPIGVHRINVNTTSEMKDELSKLFASQDVLIMAAAPADFRPATISEEKIKKNNNLTISFEHNEDILKSLSEMKKNQIVVGFAAESQNLLENAEKKMISKNLDMIVANNIKSVNTGFQSDYNEATILLKNGNKIPFPKGLKTELADFILNEVEKIL